MPGPKARPDQTLGDAAITYSLEVETSDGRTTPDLARARDRLRKAALSYALGPKRKGRPPTRDNMKATRKAVLEAVTYLSVSLRGHPDYGDQAAWILDNLGVLADSSPLAASASLDRTPKNSPRVTDAIRDVEFALSRLAQTLR